MHTFDTPDAIVNKLDIYVHLQKLFKVDPVSSSHFEDEETEIESSVQGNKTVQIRSLLQAVFQGKHEPLDTTGYDPQCRFGEGM